MRIKRCFSKYYYFVSKIIIPSKDSKKQIILDAGFIDTQGEWISR